MAVVGDFVRVEIQRLAAEDRLWTDVELRAGQIDDEIPRVEVLVILGSIRTFANGVAV